VNDSVPGIRRRRAGSTFRYTGVDGKPLRDLPSLARIKALAIPPAWTAVWICPLENGHIQATARDAKGRKQYRYHRRWRAVRDDTKFDRMLDFGLALPLIRRQVETDLALPGLPLRKVLAAVIQLLDTTLLRVGNEEYARDNQSFGLTTLRNRHVEIHGTRVQFQFRGKSGKEHRIALTDQRLARIIRHCRDLPGQELFQYIDEKGQARPIGSSDVNEYLGTLCGEDYTAKDFRTWAGTVLAALELWQLPLPVSARAAKTNIVRAMEAVSIRLGNTPAVCRKCYVHPEVIDTYLAGRARPVSLKRANGTHNRTQLRPEESALLALLKQRARLKKKPQALRVH
jgi:DNA topoisomerase-1